MSVAQTSEAAVAFANQLLEQMTLEEKVGQISQRFDIASLFPQGTPTPPGMPPLTPLDERCVTPSSALCCSSTSQRWQTNTNTSPSRRRG